MRFLLDTNLLSETRKPRPDLGVRSWIAAQPAEELAISVLSLGEIRRGVVLHRGGRRKEMLQSWLSEDLPDTYKGRMIPIDAIALEWGRVPAEAMNRGRTVPDADGLLVATAIVLNLTLVTRNERHCAGWGAPLINPWSGETRD
ncbi:MAG TPA: type II toxin-antitoxin system VapC family toxin [Longimicrobium sp.]|nr:type II toxin-antitoxin system VapC family toxin [Longimicrobium sp.]